MFKQSIISRSLCVALCGIVTGFQVNAAYASADFETIKVPTPIKVTSAKGGDKKTATSLKKSVGFVQMVVHEESAGGQFKRPIQLVAGEQISVKSASEATKPFKKFTRLAQVRRYRHRASISIKQHARKARRSADRRFKKLRLALGLSPLSEVLRKNPVLALPIILGSAVLFGHNV